MFTWFNSQRFCLIRANRTLGLLSLPFSRPCLVTGHIVILETAMLVQEVAVQITTLMRLPGIMQCGGLDMAR